MIFPNLIVQLLPIITPLILEQLTWSLPKNVTTFHGEQDGIIHFCLSPYKMGIFGTLNLHFDKKMDFSKFDFITTSNHNFTNMDQFACSLPKTNTIFHQLYKYVKKDSIFSSIRWESSINIFGRRSLIDTVCMYS